MLLPDDGVVGFVTRAAGAGAIPAILYAVHFLHPHEVDAPAGDGAAAAARRVV